MLKRVLNFYFKTAVTGTVLIIILASLLKAYALRRVLNYETAFLQAEQYEKAIEMLSKTEEWESLFPALAVRRQCLAIRCHARTEGYDTARMVADKMIKLPESAFTLSGFIQNLRTAFLQPHSAFDRTQTVLVELESIANAGMNWTLARQNRNFGVSTFSGYEVLLDELLAAGKTNQLAIIKTDLMKRYPDLPMVKNIDSYLAMLNKQYVGRSPRSPQGSKPTAATTSVKAVITNIVGQLSTAAAPPPELPLGWGIVTTSEASLHDVKGTYLRKLNRGAVLKIRELKQSKSGEIAICSLYSNDPNSDTNEYAVRSAQLELRRGTIADANQKEISLLLQRNTLSAAFVAFQEDFQKKCGTNPCEARYNKALTDYNALAEQGKALKAKFTAASGAEREKYANALRAMKPEEFRLNKEMSAAQTDSEKWVRGNAARMAADPSFINLKSRLTKVEEELAQLR